MSCVKEIRPTEDLPIVWGDWSRGRRGVMGHRWKRKLELALRPSRIKAVCTWENYLRTPGDKIQTGKPFGLLPTIHS